MVKWHFLINLISLDIPLNPILCTRTSEIQLYRSINQQTFLFIQKQLLKHILFLIILLANLKKKNFTRLNDFAV